MEQEKKLSEADNRKEKFYGRFAKGAACRSTYKSKVQGLENDTFDVGASSNPTKFSKLLKNIEQYIQKTYKDPDDMVKTIQQMKRMILNYPEKPKKTDAACCNANRDPDPDMFEMAVFAWQEDYKMIKSRMDKYKCKESNTWALIYGQCSTELKTKLKRMQGYNTAKSGNNMAKILTMICGYCCQFDLLINKFMAIVAA